MVSEWQGRMSLSNPRERTTKLLLQYTTHPGSQEGGGVAYTRPFYHRRYGTGILR